MPLRLTRLGLAAERLARGFWPFASVLMAVLAALMFGLQDVLPIEAFWTLSVVSVLALAATLALGLRGLRWPTEAEAMDRLDRTLPGRPITAITDTQAVGARDDASRAVWDAHVARMTERVKGARAVEPDLRLASRDPYALRYVAVVAFVMALLFGSFWKVASVAGMTPGLPGASIETAAWEAWIEPPVYTGKPSLYLADVAPGRLTVPQGSKATVRLYGEVGRLIVDETVSGRTGVVEGASEPAQSFEILRDGTLAIRGPGGAEWEIIVVEDKPPTIGLEGEATRTVAGEMRQDFTAADDYGVVAARARIELDLAKVDRRYGLAVDPEPREPVEIDLPLSVTGDRTEFTDTITENFAEHPWANLPVSITLTAVDAAAQEGSAPTSEIVLPGRRFFDTMALAIVEMRRDLLWNRDNATRVTQVLRAVSYRPDEGFRQPGVYLKLRTVIRRMEAALASGELTAEVRDETAAVLWAIALEIEDGNLADALERLRRAQERLAEAIRNGATDEEIAELMQELREAMQQYMQQLAQNAPPGEDQAQNQDMQTITGDQLEQMLQQLQELMEQGRTAEAQELLRQLQQMMENMQVARGQGQPSPGQEAMEGLADTLRQQQELSDDTFGDLQEQFGTNPGQQQPGQQGQDGEQQGQNGQDGQDGDGQRPGSGGRNPGQTLAERQQALRDLLEGQRNNMPGAGTPEGDAARDALGRAEGAMDNAEEALRNDDLPGALDEQAEAMEALREGMRNLGEMMAQQQNGEGQQGDATGRAERENRRDPLGRDEGANGRIGTDEQMLQGEDVYRRARELLDEIRRRSSDQERPELELDYLRRLLDRF
jgi:uncharacterized protein (TIGR02302 family)